MPSCLNGQPVNSPKQAIQEKPIRFLVSKHCPIMQDIECAPAVPENLLTGMVTGIFAKGAACGLQIMKWIGIPIWLKTYC